MAEFMEECLDLAQCQQSWILVSRFREVHHYTHMRAHILFRAKLTFGILVFSFYPLALELCHPGTTLLAFARMEVGIEHRQISAVAVEHLIGFHVGVIDGVFGLANKLYGITFKENKDIPVYHPDVKAYEVFDKDGSFLAVFYADFHPRKGKQGGAWMTEYQGQYIDRKGENVRPHVSVVMNLTKPTEDKPALLTLGEVETFLHEFGHSLHGMFANTRFESLSGTNVWWDFVELPSQFMENFAIEKEFLRTFAFHYQTGEPLPDELINRIVKSRNFMCATACLRQVSLGLLDMAYYTQKDEFTDDIIPFEKKAWKKAILGKQLPDTCMTVQFSHIMAGGYAAGYYSYKWAEVLEADAFAVFKRHGIFNQEIAQRFRDEILSKGGTEHPMTLYKNFKGREPTIDALLKRNGIKKTKKV